MLTRSFFGQKSGQGIFFKSQPDPRNRMACALHYRNFLRINIRVKYSLPEQKDMNAIIISLISFSNEVSRRNPGNVYIFVEVAVKRCQVLKCCIIERYTEGFFKYCMTLLPIVKKKLNLSI